MLYTICNLQDMNSTSAYTTYRLRDKHNDPHRKWSDSHSYWFFISYVSGHCQHQFWVLSVLQVTARCCVLPPLCSDSNGCTDIHRNFSDERVNVPSWTKSTVCPCQYLVIYMTLSPTIWIRVSGGFKRKGQDKWEKSKNAAEADRTERRDSINDFIDEKNTLLNARGFKKWKRWKWLKRSHLRNRKNFGVCWDVNL